MRTGFKKRYNVQHFEITAELTFHRARASAAVVQHHRQHNVFTTVATPGKREPIGGQKPLGAVSVMSSYGSHLFENMSSRLPRTNFKAARNAQGLICVFVSRGEK